MTAATAMPVASTANSLSIVPPQQVAKTHDRPFTAAMRPQNFKELMWFCGQLSESSICPKSLKGDPMALMVAIQAGERHGFDILGSIQNIAVINGRPCMYGDAMLGVCRSSPVWGGIEESNGGDWAKGDAWAECKVWRRGEKGRPTVNRFTQVDAIKARLTNKTGPWQEYPMRMLTFRARGFALRDTFADVLSGLISAEEAADYATVDHHGNPAEPVREPVVNVAESVDPMTKDAFLSRIMKAKTEAELTAIRDQCKETIWNGLSDSEKKEIAALRDARLIEIKAESETAPQKSQVERMKDQRKAAAAAEEKPAEQSAVTEDQIPY